MIDGGVSNHKVILLLLLTQNDKSFHFDTSSYKVCFRAFKFYQVPVPNRPAGHQYVLFRWITVLFPDKSPVL